MCRKARSEKDPPFSLFAASAVRECLNYPLWRSSPPLGTTNRAISMAPPSPRRETNIWLKARPLFCHIAHRTCVLANYPVQGPREKKIISPPPPEFNVNATQTDNKRRGLAKLVMTPLCPAGRCCRGLGHLSPEGRR